MSLFQLWVVDLNVLMDGDLTIVKYNHYMFVFGQTVLYTKM